MKKIICNIVLFSTLILGTLSVGASENISININNTEVKLLDAAPYVDGSNRTMVPIRIVSENLGAKIDWNPRSKEFTIEGINAKNNEGVTIVGQAGTPYVTVNNIKKQIDPSSLKVTVDVKNNRCYVPLRFFSTELGWDIDYANKNIGLNRPEVKPEPVVSADELEQLVIEFVNIERSKEGLSPLENHTVLSQVARMKSQDMYENDYFAHESPTYGSPFEMMDQFDISSSRSGENIAMGQRTSEQVVDSWMNSPGHRKNILGDYTHIGVGYVETRNIWTQMFINN